VFLFGHIFSVSLLQVGASSPGKAVPFRLGAPVGRVKSQAGNDCAGGPWARGFAEGVERFAQGGLRGRGRDPFFFSGKGVGSRALMRKAVAGSLGLRLPSGRDRDTQPVGRGAGG